MSCLVYLPRDRYTTAVRERMQEILRRRSAARRSTTPPRVRESVLARLHFVVRAASGRADAGDVDAAELERGSPRRPGRGATTSPTRCATSSARRRRPRLSGSYGDAFPEAYKEDFPPRDRGGRPAADRGARAQDGLALLAVLAGRRRGRGSAVQGLPERHAAVAVRRAARCCRRSASRWSTSGRTQIERRDAAAGVDLRLRPALLQRDGIRRERGARAVPGRVPGGLEAPGRERRLQRRWCSRPG